MNLDQFSEQVRQAQERATRLTEQIQDVGPHDLLPQTLEELETALEELRTALEELHARNSELEQVHHWAEQERRYYRELFEAAPDAYLVTDSHGIIQDANRAAGVMFHSPQRFLIGKPLALLVADSEIRTFRSRLSQLRHSGGPATEVWELAVQPLRGVSVRATAHISTAHDWRGLPSGLRWLLRTRQQPPEGPAQQEISPQQQSDQQSDQIAALAQRLAEEQRQSQSAEAQLAAAQQTLRTYEALMSNAAHELRNSITPIYGYADYFQHMSERLNSGDERVRRGLRIMAEQGLRIEHLAISLLEWPLIEQGHTPGPPEPLDCVALVSGVVEHMRRALIGVRIHLTSAAPALPVAGDSARLQQMLSALIQRSAQRSFGSHELELHLAETEGWATITLSDQGAPIAETVAQALQLREAALQAVDVLGASLAVACVIVARHGGRITASAQAGEGNQLTIQLPLHLSNTL